MENKQIIVDNVDVGECEYAVRGKHAILCAGSENSALCDANKNCLYKKYKRKEQENKRLLEIINAKPLETVDIDSAFEIEKLKEQLQAKEQECEELKKWKENVVNLFDKTCRCKYLNEGNAHCSFYNKECITINQCLYKNQQTLTEIKEIAEKIYKDCDDCYGDTDTNCDVDCIGCTLGGKAKLAEQILQKISEVTENENS